jgi:hypothetical protein
MKPAATVQDESPIRTLDRVVQNWNRERQLPKPVERNEQAEALERAILNTYVQPGLGHWPF